MNEMFFISMVARWTEHDGLMYGINCTTNDVIVFERDSLNIVNVIPIDIEITNTSWFHNYFIGIASSQRALYLFPYHYKGVMARYDYATKETTYSNFKEICGYEGYCLPHGIGENDNKLYFVPDKIGDDLLVFDLEKEEFYKKKFMADDLIQQFGIGTQIPFYSVRRLGDGLWFSVDKTNYKARLDLQTFQVNVFNMPFELSAEKDILVDTDESYLWIYSNIENKLFKISKGDSTYKGYNIPGVSINRMVVCAGDNIYLISNMHNKDIEILSFEKNDETFDVVEDRPNIHLLSDFRKDGYFSYCWHEKIGDKIMVFPGSADKVLEIDVNNKIINGKELILDKNKYEDYYTDKIRSLFSQTIVKEDGFFSLTSMLEGIPALII